MSAAVALLNTEEVTVAQPIVASGGVYGARDLFGGRRRPRDAGTWHAQRVHASTDETMLSVPPLQDAGPFFLDMGPGSMGASAASASLPPSGLTRGRRFVAGSRLSAAVARQRSKSRTDPARPQRDDESWQQEVDALKERIAELENEKAGTRAKLVKADKEVNHLQKLVGDVLIEQTPSMANEFKKMNDFKRRCKLLESEIEARDATIKVLQSTAKVATARKLRDEVTAYQREVARLRAQLEERTREAEENAAILKAARKKLAKHTQQTVVKTRRQTERVIAARHSADLEALAKQSSLLKRELKNMQGKDWVMECARLEGMLQEAFKIVKHAEAQRAESIAHQEEMRVSLIDREHALEAEVSAHAEESKRAERFKREADEARNENAQLADRVKQLEQFEIESAKRVEAAKLDTAHAESQLRTMRRSGVQKLQMRKLARVFVVWTRETVSSRLLKAGKQEEERLMREKAKIEDAAEEWKGKADVLEGDVARRIEEAEAESQRWQAEVNDWKSKVEALENRLAEVMSAVAEPEPEPVATQDGATYMTPQKTMQRKPSLGSILEDLENKGTDWATIAGTIAGEDMKSGAEDAAAKIEEEARNLEDERRRREQEEQARLQQQAEAARRQAEEDAAARRIQSMRRGQRDRRHVNELKASRSTESTDLPPPYSPPGTPSPQELPEVSFGLIASEEIDHIAADDDSGAASNVHILEPELDLEPKPEPEPEPEPEPAPIPHDVATTPSSAGAAFEHKVRCVTLCQAMWRGKMFRKRIQAFDNWDRHSQGSGEIMQYDHAFAHRTCCHLVYHFQRFLNVLHVSLIQPEGGG